MRFGTVVLKRPVRPGVEGLPEGVKVSFVEVVELHPPKGAEPIHWLLLTTHPVAAADAWRIVSWYKQRWIIEQLFRSLKNQGLRIEESQLETAEALIKLVAIATKAACTVIQLVQARSGRTIASRLRLHPAKKSKHSAAINKTLKGQDRASAQPRIGPTLCLGGMDHRQARRIDRYASHRPPGPITFHIGITRFQIIVTGQRLRKCVETLVRTQGPITTGFGR